MNENMTSRETAEYLGITDPRTIKNWLEGGNFPGSSKDEDGKWKFKREQVEQTLRDIERIRHLNELQIVQISDADDGYEPPLL